MPLQPPNLDDRTFEQLVAEARARIPRYTPEWTNFNDADPGMTLVKLHAWLTETILYRLNKLPDLNYIKFLELLNVRPKPAQAAQAQLSFTLKKLNRPSDPLVVLIPKNTQVGVDDPDLAEELIFETERTLTALNAALAAVIVPGTGTNVLDLVTEYDAKTAETKIPHPFYPFGDNPAVGDVALLGILPRPHRQKNQDYSLDRFPEGELDLTVFVPQVFEESADWDEILGPNSLNCLFPWEVTAVSEAIAWEIYTGTDPANDFGNDDVWQELHVMDETSVLSRSGHVYLDVPGSVPAIPFHKLARSFWEDLGLRKPPTSADELIDDIGNSVLAPEDLDEGTWETLGLGDTVANPALSDLLTLLGDPLVNFDAILDHLKLSRVKSQLTEFDGVEDDVWLDLAYDEAPAPYEQVWLRARLEGVPDEPPQVSRFALNTVVAMAAVTRVEEIVGTSNGRPNQTHTLSKSPVLIDSKIGQPYLELEIAPTQGEAETWQVVDDFFGRGPDSAVFRLDVETGLLIFGDGEHGRIPVAGAEIIARSYRYGGGAVGNAGPDTTTALRSALPDVDSVTNVRAAAGGADAETLDEVKLRAPHDLRHRERAVTGEDFADLALQTPGVGLQRAYALPLTWADATTKPPTLVPDTPGTVTVVILPENKKQETPQPTEDQLRLVCANLNDRRLITTELYVIGPRYLELKRLKVEVTVGRQFDLKRVQEAVYDKLLTYFAPLQGGEDGRGWPFGQDIYFGDVYRQLLGIEGVRRVLCLEIEPELWAHLYGRLQFSHKADDAVGLQTMTVSGQLTATADMQQGGGLQLAPADVAGLKAWDVLRLRDTADPTRTEFVRIQSSGSAQTVEPGLLFKHPLGATEVHKVKLSDASGEPGGRVLAADGGQGDALLRLNTLAGLSAGQVVRLGLGGSREYQLLRHVPKVCPDVIEVADGTLVHLPRTAINLKVTYDPYG
ncbi:MAG: putative baseplate assembly protein [Anaerolineales bacterium]|nr:putative baseplate assembly protein [Anaerolineales bacterium]